MKSILEKLKAAYGFGDTPGSIWAWVGTIGAIVGIVIVVLATSLAKHKRMVAELRAVILQKDAENRVLQLEKKAEEERHRLTALSSKDVPNKTERTSIRQNLQNIEKTLSQERPKLKKSIEELPKKSIGQLLKESDQLLKDTL